MHSNHLFEIFIDFCLGGGGGGWLGGVDEIPRQKNLYHLY